MTFLIDGYNLLHAVGLAPPRRAPAGGLEAARTKLLDWLADTTAGRPDTLRVVFDAPRGRADSEESGHRGVRVRFAFRMTADDLIEELIAAEQVPGRLAVVSNDTRLQDAARRRRCEVYTCQRFVDWVISPPAATPEGVPDENKPEPQATDDEMAAWLAAFSAPPPRRKPR